MVRLKWDGQEGSLLTFKETFTNKKKSKVYVRENICNISDEVGKSLKINCVFFIIENEK